MNRRRLLFLPLTLGICLCALAEAPRPEKVRIATYNVRNYLIEDRRVEGRWRPQYPKPEVEKKAVWAVLEAAHPDIIVFQEMGSGPFLAELQTDLRSRGLEYSYSHVVEAVDEKRHVALLSRYPFEISEGVRPLDFSYFGERIGVKRGLLEARFEFGDTAFILFGVHLKSRYTDNREDPDSSKRRSSEARTLRNYIREQFPPEEDPRYLVVGDFNDTRRSSTLNYFLSVSDTVLTEAVPATDSRGETWTYFYDSDDVYSRIDFFLASPALFPRVAGGAGGIIDIEESLVASDHRLVWIDLAVDGIKRRSP